jgi:hypothetical protein
MFPRKDKDFKVKSSIPRSLLLGSSFYKKFSGAEEEISNFG